MLNEFTFGIWIDSSSLASSKAPLISPKDYENGVRRVLLKVSNSRVGSAVLNTIRFHGRVVRIVPNIVQSGVCAGATTDEVDAFQFTANKSRTLIRQLTGIQFRPLRGKINFTPGMYAQGGACHKLYAPRSQYTPTEDEVLLHELVHAARMVSLQFSLGPGADRGLTMYENDEEFFAVLVENIYKSELQRGPLRSSHAGFMEMDKNLQGSLEFFKVSGQAFEKVNKFATQNHGLAKMLSHIDVPFNPLNAFFCKPEKAREMSKSRYAAIRDLGPIGMIFAPFFN